MSDPTPKDCYAAQEVFARFCDWYWGDGPRRTVLTKDDAPLSPEDQAARVLMQLLLRGEIQPLVRDPATGGLYRITPDELSMAGFPRETVLWCTNPGT